MDIITELKEQHVEILRMFDQIDATELLDEKKEVIKKLDIHNGDKLSYYFNELENEPTSIVLTKYGSN